MGAIQHFSTDSVTPERRLRYWNDCAAETFAGMTVDTASDEFRAEMTRWHLGDLIMARPQSRQSLVRRSGIPGEERLIVHLQRRGMVEQRQRGISQVLRGGDISVCTTDAPLRLETRDHMMLVAQLPRAPLDARLPGLDDRLGTLISGTTSAARMLHDFMLSLWRECGAVADPAWESGVADVLYDLLAMALRGTEPAPRAAGGEMARLRTLIDARLGDPDLTSATLADELGVSIRWVQHLFAELGTTPTAYISRRRLERAAERLEADPKLNVTMLAYDLGFNDSAYFARCFRRRFGTSPSGWAQAGRAASR